MEVSIDKLKEYLENNLVKKEWVSWEADGIDNYIALFKIESDYYIATYKLNDHVGCPGCDCCDCAYEINNICEANITCEIVSDSPTIKMRLLYWNEVMDIMS